MTHLTVEDLVDALEGNLDNARAAHAAQCGECRGRVAELRASLAAAGDAPIPDPSPLFWTHFSTRVHDAIAAESIGDTRWSAAWLGWRTVAPVAAMAVLLLTVVVTFPRGSLVSVTTPAGTTVEDATADEADDREWARLTELLERIDLDAARDAIPVRPGDAERVALQLDAAEQRELMRLLEEEMNKSGS